MRKTDSWWEAAVQLSSVLWGNLVGLTWKGGMGQRGREAQEGGDR